MININQNKSVGLGKREDVVELSSDARTGSTKGDVVDVVIDNREIRATKSFKSDTWQEAQLTSYSKAPESVTL